MLGADWPINLFLYYNIFFYKNQVYVMGIAVALRKSNNSTKKLHMLAPVGFTCQLRPYTDGVQSPLLVLGKRKKFKNFYFSLDKFLKLWYNGIFGLAASALGPALYSKFTCK